MQEAWSRKTRSLRLFLDTLLFEGEEKTTKERLDRANSKITTGLGLTKDQSATLLVDLSALDEAIKTAALGQFGSAFTDDKKRTEEFLDSLQQRAVRKRISENMAKWFGVNTADPEYSSVLQFDPEKLSRALLEYASSLVLAARTEFSGLFDMSDGYTASAQSYSDVIAEGLQYLINRRKKQEAYGEPVLDMGASSTAHAAHIQPL